MDEPVLDDNMERDIGMMTLLRLPPLDADEIIFECDIEAFFLLRLSRSG